MRKTAIKTFSFALCSVIMFALAIYTEFFLNYEEMTVSSALTEGDWEYRLTPPGIIITKYIGNAPDVTVPSVIGGKQVIEAGGFQDNKDIKNVVISSGIKEIGDYAFSMCRSLESVKIPLGITTIGVSAFNLCDSLTEVNIPDTVTDIKQGAFNGCCFTEITIPESISFLRRYLFSNCRLLSEVNIPESVISIEEEAFSNCYSLRNVNIPNSVISIGAGAFSRSGIETVTLPNQLSVIPEGLFYGCRSLRNVVIPDSVEEIGNQSFSSCSVLNSINIPLNLLNIGSYAFFECESLENISIPRSTVSVGEMAFAECSSLRRIEITSSLNWFDTTVFPIQNTDLIFSLEAGSYAEDFVNKHVLSYDYMTDKTTSENTKPDQTSESYFTSFDSKPQYPRVTADPEKPSAFMPLTMPPENENTVTDDETGELFSENSETNKNPTIKIAFIIGISAVVLFSVTAQILFACKRKKTGVLKTPNISDKNFSGENSISQKF